MRGKTLKKILSIGLAGVMMMSSLAGCGGDTDEAAPSEIEEAEPEVVQEVDSEEPVTIRFASTYGEAEPGHDQIAEILEQFQKDHPNITVELEVQSSTQYHEKLVSEIASDTLANVFMHWGGAEMIEAVQSGKVLDVTDMMDADPEFKAQFADVTLHGSNTTYEGMEGIWGVPFSSLSGGFYYNKALFEEAGIENVPETWSEVLDAVEKLNAIDVIPIAMGAKDGWRVEHLYSAIFYRLNGVEGAKKLGTRELKYSDPEAVEAWEMIQELVDMEAFGPEPASVDFANEMVMVQTGKAAMNFSLSGFITSYTGEESEVADDIEFFNMPVIEGHEEYAADNFGGGDICLGIATNATEEQIAASWELCKALSGVDGQTKFANANAFIIANAQVESDPAQANRLSDDFASVINDANALCVDVVNYDSVATMLTKIRDVATALVNGQLTPLQAGEELDAEVELYSE